MIAADLVLASLVTRGDVDMAPVVESLPFDIVVWDNSKRTDHAVFGRYAAIADVPHDVVYVQDDDCVLPSESIEALLAAYEPGKLVANMPAEYRTRYPDSCLVGFGAIFDRQLPAQAVARLDSYLYAKRGEGFPEHFHRTCDIAFSMLTPRVLVDVPFEMLPHTRAANRMYLQPGNTQERQQMIALCRKVRDGR